MEHRTLGRTGVSVSKLCLGTMMFGAWGNPDHDDSIRIIHAALDAGINFVDTADVYSAGESEEIVGKALAGRRDDVVLATKVGFPMGDDANRRGASRRRIVTGVEDSLRRLGTDWIDLYQIHRPDPSTDIEETLGALTDLVQQGKVRYIGSSTYPAPEIVEAQWAARDRNLQRYVTEQPPYSILVRGIEADILPTCARHEMGVIPWAPLASGWLSGRWRKGSDQPGSTRADRLPDRYDLSLPGNQRKLDVADELAQLAEQAGMTLIELAIAFVANHPAVTAPIIGPRTMEHLESQLPAADVVLDDALLDRIDALVPPGTNLNATDAGWTNPFLEPGGAAAVVIRQSFNAGWSAGPGLTGFGRIAGRSEEPLTVTLPYDAVRDLARSADSSEGPRTGNFPGGLFEYAKTFEVPDGYRDKSVTLEFEGVYRDATVSINGEFAAQRPNGYTNFYVKADPYLRYGEANTVEVQARANEDSRWYTGAGIYRDTKLIVGELVHVALDGVRITTPDVDAERALVAIATTVENEGRATRTVRVTTEVRDAAGAVVASGSAPVTLLPGASEVVRMRLLVGSPALWSADAPNLYAAQTTVTDDNGVLDEERTGFGIRTLQLDPQHGLRINGEPVDLRGACVHHDNGLLGSAAIGRAEERRVELLKAAGFNAIRSAHNPISKAMLDACDRVGMLVMDETFDIWTEPKAPFDYALAFPEWWERDVEAMVAKDFNHPSVILYSIGNEIFETGRPIGSVWGRKLAEKVRSLDDTRFVTNAINHLASVAHRLLELLGDDAGQVVDINTFIAAIGDTMQQVSANEDVTRATEESHAVLDVSGINYGHSRYTRDREQFPNRIIVGSETFPDDIGELWQLVRENAHVIGDFTWTGWDYLGEAGIGRVDYPDEDYVSTGISAPYPWLTGSVGDIDITGHRRPQSYYRETVFGLRHAPYIAVHRPQFHGRPTLTTPWSWTDSVASWSWDLPAGSPATVDVYSDADEVELLLNDRSVGRTAVGTDKACLARFELTYEPGELVAVATIAGKQQARTALRTAGEPLRLTATADRHAIRAGDSDLAYITIALQDDDGTLASHRDRLVSVNVSGAGVLSGLGSADPRTEEPFGGSQCTTFDGRALAIVRPTGPGEIEIHVSAEDCEPVTAAVTATL